ncbi:ficolin-2-like [Pecten maximus]|uniref:ficolin-2-like n=1 Tax=Pecten maximus TaxID=6579 RepID=UPI0014586EE5|nr:ficolin-2-like [Pecten maximus]
MYFSKVLFDCSDISIESSSGVYEIRTTPGKRVDLFCDTDTADGPWTVIQRRTIGDVDFYRNWTDYKNGFGDLLGDFWIGNDNLHDLTTSPRILRVELEGLDGTKGYAQYSNFQVANEDQNYRLLVQGFSGNVSYDAMASHNDQSFSTYDRDNDKASGNCASNHNGAWWYWNCFHSNLNAGFVTDEEFNERKVILWYFFPNVHGYDPTKTSMMMIR